MFRECFVGDVGEDADDDDDWQGGASDDVDIEQLAVKQETNDVDDEV